MNFLEVVVGVVFRYKGDNLIDYSFSCMGQPAKLVIS